MEVSEITKKRIKEYLKQSKRFDGRSLFEYRDISIKTGISKNAEGSAEVYMGQTRVIAGVKLDIAEPYPDSEDAGNLMVTVELLPLASEKFQPGPPDVHAIEMARIVDRGIRESGFIDFKKLCIKKGEKVWSVMIDIYPLNDDGNLIDASALAVIAALQSAVFPVVKDEKVEYGEFTTKRLPLTKNLPITSTFYKIGENVVIDPTAEEEEASDTRLSITISEKSEKEAFINAMQKGGCRGNITSTFTREGVFKIIDLALKEQEKLRKIFKEKLQEQEDKD